MGKGSQKTICQLLVAFDMFLVVSHILISLSLLNDKTSRQPPIALASKRERERKKKKKKEERERDEPFLTGSILEGCERFLLFPFNELLLCNMV